MHPIAALKLKKIDQQCDSVYKAVSTGKVLDGYGSGGQLDAFRHIFYFSAFSQKISIRKLRKLGIAYENKNYKQFQSGENNPEERHDSLAMVMDLRNNELAFKNAQRFKDIDLVSLRDSTFQMIKEGEAWIFLRNKSGRYLDCNGNVLHLEKYNHSWYIPKCLVSSDSVYRD